MPHLNFSRDPQGWVLPVMVGVNGRTTAALVALGQPVPTPQFARALFDTGSNVTTLNSGVLARLGLAPIRRSVTTTVAGSVRVNLFEVSLSVAPASPPGQTLLVLSQLVVMEAPALLTGVDALLGLDVLDHLLLTLDAQRGELTVAD